MAPHRLPTRLAPDALDRLAPVANPDAPEELEAGRFSLVCPRHGVRAEVHIEAVSGSVRSFSCSVPGDDEPGRQRCQAACARWLLGDSG